MSRTLTISKEKVIHFDRPKSTTKKSVSQRLVELKEVLDRRGLTYTEYAYDSTIVFRIEKVRMADTERHHRDSMGTEYDYTWGGFKCEVVLRTPPSVRPLADDGMLIAGGFKHPRSGEFIEVESKYHSLPHPHFNGARMCLAMGWEDEFGECLEHDNWNGLVDVVIASISQYSSVNPYRHLPHENPDGWDYPDDDEYFDDDYWDCEYCGSSHHDDEHWRCNNCGHSICESCSYSCNNCGEALCEQCTRVDAENDDQYCPSCYSDCVLHTDCDWCATLTPRDDIVLCSCWAGVCPNCAGTCDRCGATVCESCVTEVELEDGDGNVYTTENLCRGCS